MRMDLQGLLRAMNSALVSAHTVETGWQQGWIVSREELSR